MILGRLLANKLKFLFLLCSCLVAVHFVINQIPILYDNAVMRTSTWTIEIDPFEAVLQSMANTTTDKSTIAYNLNFTTDSTMNVTFFNELNAASDQMSLPMCNQTPPGLHGPIRVFTDSPPMAEIEKMYPDLMDGGHGKPEECIARHRVAVIVPYRDREMHLKLLLHNLHLVLKKQQLDYAIFIVEQVANQTFNRGKLMNVGYDVASKIYPWQCFIFHDVDLLPEDDRNLYTCPSQPRHMSVAVDKFGYKLPYSAIFGGVSALSKEHILKINGFSNDFWGWGGEDDDLSTRTQMVGYKVSRYPAQIAKYKMIKHDRESSNPTNPCRHKIMARTRRRYIHDGLSNLKYKVTKMDLKPLYTNVVVDLLEKESKLELRREFPTCY